MHYVNLPQPAANRTKLPAFQNIRWRRIRFARANRKSVA